MLKGNIPLDSDFDSANKKETAMSGRNITWDDKIACLKREIAMRERVYAKRVDTGMMRQDKADREISIMEAILEDIQNLAGRKE